MRDNMGRLTERDLMVSASLLKQLSEEFERPEFLSLGPDILKVIIDDMEKIKFKMQKHYLRHRQIEVVEQMIGFDVLINYARKLQNKDVASM
jgi:hypothetical protein